MISFLQVENLSKRFGEQLLFENISFGIGKNQKVALIAKNGTGKSTLLQIIAGKDSPETGRVIFRNDITVGYLEQAPDLNPENTIFEEVFCSDSPTLKVIKEYERAVELNDIHALETLISQMDALSAWDYENTVKQILSKLKIDTYDKEIKYLSGGQKKRVGLAKVLISNPDFLILDEPTNHLDTEMTEWLEEYLTESNATLLMVTHDRYFLDRVCNQIIEIDDFGLYSYNGNYSYYLEKREQRIENRNATIDKARNLLRTEQEWMRRMPQARSHKAQYRIDNFYKIKDIASQRTDEKKLELDIKGQRLGKKILELEHICKSFDSHCLVRDFSYKFIRGEKIGIVGKNGIGKSTFLNIITRNLEPDSGSIEIGETVVYGYYQQSGIRFNENDRVIDIVKNIAERIDLGNGQVMSASQFLEYFMFTDKQQYSLVEKLSGGERRRLYLLTVLMRNPNFLILDEPTNDLDIVTLNVLEEYLKSFKGCLLLVSHDRFFTDKLADHIFAFEGDGVIKDFPGNYTQYKNWKEEEEEKKKKERNALKSPNTETKKSNSPTSAPVKIRLSFKEKQEFQSLEKEIEELNAEKTLLETELSQGHLSPDELIKKSERIGQLIEILDEKEMRWLELSEISN
ncbi:MAG: ABC-F family ATP-binding cassette domain-containing protein [Oscillibacter sp.]|nr:ABC-F family ATP-binding cassette domain-containing protein [Oscillibacter sp.]